MKTLLFKMGLIWLFILMKKIQNKEGLKIFFEKKFMRYTSYGIISECVFTWNKTIGEKRCVNKFYFAIHLWSWMCLQVWYYCIIIICGSSLLLYREVSVFLFHYFLYLFKQVGDFFFFSPASCFPCVHLYTYKFTREEVKMYTFCVVNSI